MIQHIKKNHIALVGGQATPVYQGIVYTNPDRVILVHSSETKLQAERIQNEITYPAELYELPPEDLTKIQNKIDAIAGTIGEDEILSINVTSGTKPWSLMFYEKFCNRPATQVFYIDQNAKVWDFKTLKSQQLAFDMNTQFRLHGNPLTQYRDLTYFNEKDFKLITEIEELRVFNYVDFNKLTTEFEEKPNITHCKLASGSFLIWSKTEKSFEIGLASKSQGKTVKLFSPHIRLILLNAGWLELKVAKILSQWDKVKEIRLNCIFPTKENSPKNEIDIIADIGSKLLFVECKTQIKKETDIDKFASAVRNYGGMAAKAILITHSVLNPKAIEKCNDNGILYFSLNQDTTLFPVEKMLISLLESELLNINPK